MFILIDAQCASMYVALGERLLLSQIWREKNRAEKTKECGSTWQCLHGSPAFTGVMRSVPSGEVMAASNVATYEFDSFICGYHVVYMHSWTPEIGEILNCVPEKDNAHVRNAVSVIKESGAIVGHIPEENSRVYKFFIQRGMVGLSQWRLPWLPVSNALDGEEDYWFANSDDEDEGFDEEDVADAEELGANIDATLANVTALQLSDNSEPEDSEHECETDTDSDMDYDSPNSPGH